MPETFDITVSEAVPVDQSTRRTQWKFLVLLLRILALLPVLYKKWHR